MNKIGFTPREREIRLEELKSGGGNLPEGAAIVEIGFVEYSFNTTLSYNSDNGITINYYDAIEIGNDATIRYHGEKNIISNITAETDLSVLYGKYIEKKGTGSTPTIYYYIKEGATFVVSSDVKTSDLMKACFQRIDV